MTFASELDCYLAKMRAREPMVMYRFGDGELMLIDGVAVGPETQASRTDRWEAPAGQSRLGRDIATALATQEPWAHFGIPCPCCNLAGYERLKHLPNAFPANLFINANHKRFLNALPSLEEVALVSNERATFKGARMGGTLAVRWMPVPDNCVNFYEENREIVLGRARAFARDLPDRSLVLVAAGPLSEALLFFMWNEAPRHTYVDVGSTLDEQLYGVKTRAYMIDGNPYATKECALPEVVTALSTDLLTSRFFVTDDEKIADLVLPLPAPWWSRGYEYAWARRFVSPKDRVLDAACGISHPFKFWLAAHAKEAHACDEDPRIEDPVAIADDMAFDFGRSVEFGPLHFRRANLINLPYEDAFFDRVFCISVLEHMRRDELVQALCEFRRVLTPEGLAVITFDVPTIDPRTFAGLVTEAGFRFLGKFDTTEHAGPVQTTMYGGLRCFRAILRS